MFTGIIPAIGRIVKIKNTTRGRFITVEVDLKIVRKVLEGGSVSVDGVCLTAIDRSSAALYVPLKRGMKPRATSPTITLTFELMDFTLKRATLGTRKIGQRVNVEPAMCAGQPIGGHFVSGHVDGVGRIKNVELRIKNNRILKISVPGRLARYFVPQGSVAVNGVSLTVVDVGDAWFSVALTRYTAKHTNLGALRVGESVNIETDMFAKYIINFLNC